MRQSTQQNRGVKEFHLTAIIYTNVPQVNGSQFLKYRKIDSRSPAKLASFEKFARGFPGAVHVNYYGAISKQFIKQVKFDV